MAEVASAFVSLLPSMKGFGSKLDKGMAGEGKRAGGLFGKAFGVVAGLAIGAKAIGILSDSIGEAREAQKVGALTTQVIKSTGGAANVSAKQVGDLATAISNKTGIDDEAVQSASNLLLTFKNVRNEVGKGNDVFNQATQIATDMGAALGKDPKSGAIQLGKALNDPIKGIAALSRVGVTFDEGQKKTITRLVESGKTMDAQKIILKELRSEFGGAAAASSTAGEKAAVAWGNLKEQLGTALLPAIDTVATAFTTKVAPAISKGIGAIGPAFGKAKGVVSGWVSSTGTTLGKVWDSFNAGGKTVDALKGTFATVRDSFSKAFSGGGKGGGLSALLGPLSDLASTVSANVLPVVGKLGEAFRGQFLPVVAKVASSLVANLVPVLRTASNTFRTVLLPAVLGLGKYLISNLWPIISKVWGIVATQLIPIIGSLAKWLYGTLYPAVIAIVVSVGSKLKPVFDAIFAAITNSVLPAVRRLLAKFKEWLPTIQMVIGVVVKVIGWVLKFAAAILGKVLPPIIRFAGWLIGALVGALSTVIGWVIKIIGWVVKFGVGLVNGAKKVGEFVSGLKDRFGDAVAYVKDIPGKIGDALGNLGSLLVDKGKDVVTGLWDGIKSMGSWLSDKLIGFAKDIIPGPIAKALGIGSPSKVMAEQARWIPIGMAQGIESEASTVQSAMDRLGRGLAVPRIRADVAPGGAGGMGGRRLMLVLSDGRALDAYVREVADGSVADAAAYAGTRRRMG